MDLDYFWIWIIFGLLYSTEFSMKVAPSPFPLVLLVYLCDIYIFSLYSGKELLLVYQILLIYI